VLEDVLGRVSAGENLSMEEMAGAIDAIMQGGVPEGQMGLLLTSLRAKGETAEEVAGAALAMRRHMVRIRCRHDTFIDTCGTGGDASQTFNISTAAAIVTAAAGLPVAKHGNRKITSKTGSADVLQHLGINVEASVPQVVRCLDELGICFCFAPLMHPAMKHVAAVRKKLAVPTIFNLLGPLTNPAGAPYQLLGVGQPHLQPLLAEALCLLGVQRAMVVCGADGLDEVTIAGETQVVAVEGENVERRTWSPDDFGLPRAELDSIRVEGPAESAEMIRQVLDGQPGPARDIVVINSAAALMTAGKTSEPQAAASAAQEAIDRGAAKETVARLVELTAA